MKSFIRHSLVWLIPCLLAVSSSAADTEEERLIGMLQSNASFQEKDAACARLKRFGTAQSIPALGSLLLDEQLSHSARYALESMESPEAGKCLLDALPRARGLTKAGIIGSLGVRRETQATSALEQSLGDADSTIASAAARALGQIGTAEALNALEPAAGRSRDGLRDAIEDGILACATRLLEAGKKGQAARSFRALYGSGQKEFVRVAAYRGMILSAGDDSLSLLKDGLLSPPGPAQEAALQLVHDMHEPGATELFCEVLRKCGAPLQVAVIKGLSQRADPSAVATLAEMTSNAVPEVRVAVLDALGLLAGGSAVPLLAEAAASSSGAEQSAARQALALVRGPDAGRVFLDQLERGSSKIQGELARALGQRGDTTATPRLLVLANDSVGSTRLAALQALALLANQEQVPTLVRLTLESNDQEGRTQAAEALNTVLQRIITERGSVDPAPLLAGLNSASVESQLTLLPLCRGIAHAEVRGALRARLKQSNPQLRAVANRTLCETVDPELLPDLRQLANSAPEETFRLLAVRACVRLISENAAQISGPQKLALLKSLLEGGEGAERTRVILAGLAELAEPAALQVVRPFLGDPSLVNEAGRAAIKLATTNPDTETAKSVLKQVAASATEPGTREAATTALKSIEARQAYLTSWRVAGPYQEAGKDFAALFDVAFAPEKTGGPAPAWQSLAAGTDPQRPWCMDLLKHFGGEQCVAYARTAVFSPREQPAVLEVGSDDGVKIWLNGAQIYANNIARPLTPNSDRANLVLKSGWNTLLLKVTQNNLGWEFSARLLAPDGSTLDGLKADAAHDLSN